MEKDIFGHDYGKGEDDVKLADFIFSSTPEKTDMGSIKKKTYAKIHRSRRRARLRRMVAGWLAAAACVAVVATLWLVPDDAIDGLREQAIAAVSPATVTVKVPTGERMTIMLPDGTKLVANSRSEIRYPEKFTGDTREIYASGEVFLDVARDEEHPFVVRSKGFEMKVLGTKFNIFNYDGKYSNVVLVQGSVEVTTGSRDKVTMRPSQLLDITDGKLDGLRTVDTSQYTSWMNDIMDLHGDGLHQVVERLNHYYGTDIGVRGNFSSTPLYGKLVYKKNIDEVLKAINIITGTRLTVSGGRVYVSK